MDMVPGHYRHGGSPLAARHRLPRHIEFSATDCASPVLTVAFRHDHPLTAAAALRRGLPAIFVVSACNHFRLRRLIEQRRNRTNGSRIRSRAV
jgi:hypothetical protein